jgi:mannosyltransferase
VLAAIVVTSGFAVRYTAVVLPAYLMLGALGLSVLPRRWQLGATSVLVVAGLISGAAWIAPPRTQAGEVTAALSALSRPGEPVGVCPDQLGPALARLLPARLGLVESAFADPAGPALVNWVDYASRMATTSTSAYAQRLLAERPPGGTIWLVAQGGYRTLGNDCDQIAGLLSAALGPPVSVVTSNGDFEHENLLAFTDSATAITSNAIGKV